MPTLRFDLLHGKERTASEITIESLVIAGWTGRDKAEVDKHIEELAAIGVKPPASVPIFYRAAASRVTTADAIEVTGEESSGEVEFVLLQAGGRLWVGTGSDHTDRKVEAYSITVSKHMCDKPIAPALWAFEDVEPHWDRLVLRAWAVEGTERRLYQQGSVAAMLAPRDLMRRYGGLAEGTLMFGGTFPVQGGVRAMPRFEFELEDPVLRRRITHGYDVKTLPVLG
jgi:hypothetical protein